jgi:neutral ceramidase
VRYFLRVKFDRVFGDVLDKQDSGRQNPKFDGSPLKGRRANGQFRAALISGATPMRMSKTSSKAWRFGAASVDITPTTPQFMIGYFRTKPSEGVYHPIYAKVLYMTDGEKEAVLVAADNLFFCDETTPSFRRAISAACGVPAGNIVMSATHTHCAPRICDHELPDGTGPSDPSYVASLQARMAEAALSAKRNARVGRVEFSRVRSRLGVNRRQMVDGKAAFAPNPEGAHDRAADTRWIMDRDGKMIATVTSYGCHPTVLGGQLTGADYPGYFKDRMERKVGGVALWSIGCAGNIRPWFTGTVAEFGGGTVAHAKQMGYAHAREVLGGRERALPVELGRLGISRRRVNLPMEKPWTDRRFRQLLDRPTIEQYGAGLQKMLDEIHRRKPAICEVQVLSLNPNHHLVYFGGEICTEIGIGLRDLCPGQIVTPHGCANSVPGYVAAENMFPQGGYEVVFSRFGFGFSALFKPNVQEYLWQAALQLIAANRKTAGKP